MALTPIQRQLPRRHLDDMMSYSARVGLRHLTFGKEMFFHSLFYERNVLTHLERVQQLPPHVQAQIAMRVSNFIDQARSVSDEFLVRFAQAAREELTHALEKGVKSDMDPLWAAPAISLAWCDARLGWDNGNMNQHSALAIITAVETFTSKRASSLQREI